MKKLISKNPVQRFKIIKALQGIKTPFEKAGENFGIKTNNNGNRYFTDYYGLNYFENGDIYSKNGRFLGTNSRFRQQYNQKNATNNKIKAKTNNSNNITTQEEWNRYFVSQALKHRDEEQLAEALKRRDEEYLAARYPELQKSNNQKSTTKKLQNSTTNNKTNKRPNQSSTNSVKVASKNQTNITTPSRVQKRVNTVTSPRFRNMEIQKGSNLLYTWGKTKGSKGLDAVGVQKNWRESDRFSKFMQGNNDIYNYLVEANGGNPFGNTQELQKFINSKLLELSEKNNKNYGSIVVDNKFGNQTEEGARLVYELLKNGPIQNAYMAPTSQVTSNKYSNPGMQFNKAATHGFLNSINARYTDDLISGIMNMNKDDLTKQQIYSRAGITSDMDENAIRDRLGNTFAQLGIHGHLGGNDKRRFRNWFNTQETPQSAAHIQTPESVVHVQTPTRNLFSGLDNWNKQIKSRYSFLKKGGLIKV